MAELASLATAFAAHPSFTVDRDAFAAHVASIDPPPHALADVYLAFAAATGDAAAVDTLETEVMPAAAAALRVVGATTDTLDECVQRVRLTLLLGRGDDHRPRLLDYRGRGALRAWVRVIAVREQLMMHRGRKEIPLGDAVLAAVPDPADDPELRYLRGEMRDQLAVAIRAALVELTARERTLLRYSLIDDLTLDEIGAIYTTHKSTVSRWLARTRERLWELARDKLAIQLAGQTDQISSLVRGLRDSLDLSLERLLG
ncbi:MAG TPA: sigma-70 family RNA polymerase sigma factor [Kofleriaceae bacterium]|nr:sigma-70 family RNA polymerase sigma factor [Kofleriaceae bacterium]